MNPEQAKNPKLCPKCRLPLDVALYEGIQIDTCAKCSGIWVDAIEEKELLSMKPTSFSIDELKRLRKFYEPLSKTDEVRYVPCPICGELMQRKNWGSHSAVIVDKCIYHGTWYDAGELEKIKEYVLSGGVEYEKLKSSGNEISDLQEKLRKEVHQLDMKVHSAYRRARLWSLLGL